MTSAIIQLFENILFRFVAYVSILVSFLTDLNQRVLTHTYFLDAGTEMD